MGAEEIDLIAFIIALTLSYLGGKHAIVGKIIDAVLKALGRTRTQETEATTESEEV